MTRIAIVGLAHSHPYSYTKILQRMGHEVAYVWDDDPTKVEQYIRDYGGQAIDDPLAVPVDQVDGAILAARLPARIDHVIHYLNAGLPVYSGKPMAVSGAQIDRQIEAASRSDTPLLTTSVLRFAPALQRLHKHIQSGASGTLVSVRGVSAHRIQTYMAEPPIWQDDPQRGGGTLINMGVHALEMLTVVAGHQFQDVTCRTAKRHHLESLSEDVAALTLGWRDGLLGTAEIIGGVPLEYYTVEVFGSAGVLRMTLPSGVVQDHRGGAVGDVDPYEEMGYVGTMLAFLEMCKTGISPVPVEESAAVARVLLRARVAANQAASVGSGTG